MGWDIVLTPRGRSSAIILEGGLGWCWRKWSLFHLLRLARIWGAGPDDWRRPILPASTLEEITVMLSGWSRVGSQMSWTSHLHLMVHTATAAPDREYISQVLRYRASVLPKLLWSEDGGGKASFPGGETPEHPFQVKAFENKREDPVSPVLSPVGQEETGGTGAGRRTSPPPEGTKHHFSPGR